MEEERGRNIWRFRAIRKVEEKEEREEEQVAECGRMGVREETGGEKGQ